MIRGLFSVAAAGAILMAPGLPAAETSSEVTGIMERVADWQLDHPSPKKPLEWENGAL